MGPSQNYVIKITSVKICNFFALFRKTVGFFRVKFSLVERRNVGAFRAIRLLAARHIFVEIMRKIS